MQRKWTTLAITLSSAALLTAGAAFAADEDSPLHKIMEQVNAKNLVVTKGVRTAVAYKKAQKDVEEAAKVLAKLGKESRELTDGAKKAKDVKEPVKKWQELMDEFVTTSEKLATVAGKAGSTNVEAKDAHSAVKKSCTACHDVFRVDEEGF